jgi:hypothetical protein
MSKGASGPTRLTAYHRQEDPVDISRRRGDEVAVTAAYP